MVFISFVFIFSDWSGNGNLFVRLSTNISEKNARIYNEGEQNHYTGSRRSLFWISHLILDREIVLLIETGSTLV